MLKPVLLPRKSHGWRSLVGCSPWGHYEWDATERLDFHFSLSHNGEGNGNPLQCSCLENPRDRRAWWAAIYGVAQSQTQLKRLSIFHCKMMLLKCYTQYASKFGKLSSGHRTGKGHFSFQSQGKAMTKNAQTTTQLHSSHKLAK